MSMTRKHYVALAGAIKEAVDANDAKGFGDACFVYAGAAEALLQAAQNISDVLAADNPRFDEARFLRACGFDL